MCAVSCGAAELENFLATIVRRCRGWSAGAGAGAGVPGLECRGWGRGRPEPDEMIQES